MIFPIRCFTCNKVLADKSEYYFEKLKGDKDDTIDINKNKVEKTKRGKLLDELGVTRYCCRIHFIGHVSM